MKLVFLCGSLEQGSDGVGDYTQTLAKQLVRLGHSVTCISINDKFINTITCCSLNLTTYCFRDLNIYRCSQATSWISKFRKVHNILASIKPDWVSLQYVPYSYSRNGLPFQFTCFFFLLSGPWKWHIMFHELWTDGGANLKKIIVSQTQKRLIQILVHISKPSIVTTSIYIYKCMLAQLNISSSILTLHSNITIHENGKPLPINSQRWIFVFFGSLDKKWQSEPFFSYIEAARCSCAIDKCIFLKLGRSSESSSIVWDHLSSAAVKLRYPAFQFVDAGEQTEAGISVWLMKATYGVSMAPLQWIGKSGSVAAMIDHGLPVIVPKYDVPFDAPPLESFPFASQLVLIDSSLVNKLQQLTKFPTRESVAQTAACQIKLFGG